MDLIVYILSLIQCIYRGAYW